MQIHLSLYIFLLIELSFVAFLDFKYRVIKNYWSVINLIIALVLFVSQSSLYPFSLGTFQFSIAFFIVGFLLYLLNVMGGGDSKFLATFFLLIPLNQQEAVFYYLLLITIIIGLAFFLKNIIINFEKLINGLKMKNKQMVKECFGTKFPYAPVIWVTWIWMGIKTYLI